MGILIALFALTLVIALHEYGHYLACRAVGIPVTEFSVGLGSSLLSRQGKTKWSLRAIPIGGYVKMDEDAYKASAWYTRIFVSLAGPAANLLPFIIICALTGTLGMFFGLMLKLYGLTFYAVWETLTLPFQALGWMAEAKADVTGPVGIVSTTTKSVVEAGALSTFIVMLMVLNISVALFNLLPIPPLDGGHAITSLVEGTMGKEIADRVRVVTTAIGVILLLTLFLIVTVRDIVRLFS